MENLISRSEFIAELAERSPIIIQNSNNPSSRKNWDVRPYDRTTVQPYDHTTVRSYKVLLLVQLYKIMSAFAVVRVHFSTLI